MFENELSTLSTADLLESAAEERAAEQRSAARSLVHAVVYADRFHPDASPDRPGRRGGDGRERAVVLGGDGCPPVLEFCISEYGAVVGVSPGVARDYLANALALRHRFPFVWARVLGEEVAAWKARNLARDCEKLSLEAALYVDQRVAHLLDSISPTRLAKIIKAAKMHADPAQAKAEADEKARERGVWVGQSDEHGTKTCVIKAASGAVLRHKAKIDQIADALLAQGDKRSIHARRAEAVGILPDSAFTNELIARAQQHHRTTPTPDPTPVSDPTPAPGAPPTAGSAPGSDLTPAVSATPASGSGPASDAPPTPGSAPTSDSTPASGSAPTSDPTPASDSGPVTDETVMPDAASALDSTVTSDPTSVSDAVRASNHAPGPAVRPAPMPPVGPSPALAPPASASTAGRATAPAAASAPDPALAPASATSPATASTSAPDFVPVPDPGPAPAATSGLAVPPCNVAPGNGLPADRAGGVRGASGLRDASGVHNDPRRGDEPGCGGEPSLDSEPGPDDEADRDAPHPGDSDLPDPLDHYDGWAAAPFETASSGSGAGESMTADELRALAARLAQVKRDAHARPPGERPAPARPGKTEVYVHLTDHTLATGTGVLRAEEIEPLLTTQFTELAGYGPYVVKPVIDLNKAVSSDAYEISDEIRERVRLTHPVELFPYGTRESSQSIDLDHIQPYDPLGPPGQTNTQNLAPLSRFGHRVKTHAHGWKVRRIDTKTIEWTTPHGFVLHVNPTGTHRLSKDSADR